MRGIGLKNERRTDVKSNTRKEPRVLVFSPWIGDGRRDGRGDVFTGFTLSTPNLPNASLTSRTTLPEASVLACTSITVQEPINPKGSHVVFKSLPSPRADSAVHFLDNLAWRSEAPKPVTSWMSDQATSAANHSAELIPLQGTCLMPSPKEGKSTKA